jgi:hypothetical protein
MKSEHELEELLDTTYIINRHRRGEDWKNERHNNEDGGAAHR